MEKLKLRNEKVSWTQCNFHSVNQLTFKLFEWAPPPDLQRPPGWTHMFLVWSFTIPLLLHSIPKTKLNCSGFPEMACSRDLCSSSITPTSIIKCPKLRSKNRPGSHMTFFNGEQTPGQKVTFQHPAHPQGTLSLSPLTDQSPSYSFSIRAYVRVSLLKGKFLKGWLTIVFYSLAANIASVQYIPISLMSSQNILKNENIKYFMGN